MNIDYALLKQHLEQKDEFRLGCSQFDCYLGEQKYTIAINRLLHTALLHIQGSKFETYLIVDRTNKHFKYKIIGHRSEYISDSLTYSTLEGMFRLVFNNLQELNKPPAKLYIKTYGQQPRHILELQAALIKSNGKFQDADQLISVVGHVFAHGVTPSHIALRVHNESPYHLYVNRSTGRICCEFLNVPALDLNPMEISFESVAAGMRPETQGCFQILELE